MTENKIFVVSVVRDFAMYDKCVRHNHNVADCILSPIDNSVNNSGVGVCYNRFLTSRPSDDDAWYVFCHEDFECKENLAQRIDQLDCTAGARDSIWGPIGAMTRPILGLYHQWRMLGSVVECHKDGSNPRTIGRYVHEGTEVETFDCQCLIVHSSLVKRHTLRFDEQLTFDLYVEDFCIAAHEKAGIPSRILPIAACHWSGGSVQSRYYEQEAYLATKYPTVCYTGTSSWCIGGKTTLPRKLTITVKKSVLSSYGNMRTLYVKFKMWGFSGVFNCLVRRCRRIHLNRILRKHSRFLSCKEQPLVGITIVGTLSSSGAVNKTLRDFAFSLKDAGIPFQTLDLGSHEIPDCDIAPILTDRRQFDIGKYTHLIEMLSSPIDDALVKFRGRIVFWEFEHGLKDAYPTLYEKRGDVIAMSDFNVTYYKKALPSDVNVYKILYPFRMQVSGFLDKAEARRKFGVNPDAFVVFYNFSLKSGYYRKNPICALEAFKLAFSHTRNARIVFKVSQSDGLDFRKKEFYEFATNNGFADRLLIIDNHLTQVDLYSLTNACDVYLSPHRSEGFGLGIAEAMSLGKVAVVSNYGGNTEFCSSENSILVPAKIVSINKEQFEHPWYLSAQSWGEPDVEFMARELVRLYNDRDLLNRLGVRAKQTIKEHFSLDNFKQSVLQYLAEPAGAS